jgi:RNA polymerase sigma factor (TIGR02999 family)
VQSKPTVDEPSRSERTDSTDPNPVDALVPLVHDELRRIARRHLRRVGAEGGRGVLCTDELVNEAYLKLRAGAGADWVDRAHFCGVAAHAMRQVLVDHARREQAQKRGGGLRATTLSSRHGAYETRLDELLALDEALDKLDVVDTRLRRIVEHLFFGGMTQEQVAGLLDVSTRTVEREWKKAKLFLYRALHEDASTTSDEP